MSYQSKIVIKNREIRIDRDTQFISVTDLGNAVGTDRGKEFVRNWLRSPTTLEFISEWEKANNPNFTGAELYTIRMQSGSNAFRISVEELVEAGATGIIAKGGKYGGTYCSIDWTIHFANWLSPKFYVHCIHAYRKLIQQLYGPDKPHQPFRWELVVDN